MLFLTQEVTQLYTSAKQHKRALLYYTMQQECKVIVLMFYGQAVRHRKLSVTLSNIKWSRYRPGVAQRVGRGIILLFHVRSTRRGRVVSSTPRSHFTPGYSFYRGLGGPQGRSGRDSIPDCPARSQSLYRVSYPAHVTLRGFIIYRVIQNDCQGLNNLSYTTHLR